MLICLLLSLVWILSSGKSTDPDIWWHLRNAEYLFQNHHLPNQDFYSFTAAGHAWMNHEWLAEIPFYLSWREGGQLGIWTVWVVLVLGIFLGLLYLCHRSSRNIKSSFIACSFCAFLAVVGFGPRMILFGYVYMIVLLIILERFRSEGQGPLWLLPLLFCLWVNTHGSWLIGLLVFGIVFAAGLIEGRWGRIESNAWNRSQLYRLVAAGTASVAALFINPFGWRLVLYPFQFASEQTLNVANIVEWASVNFHNSHGTVVLLLLAILFSEALFRNRSWALTELALLLFGLYLGLTYIRFLFLLALVAAPVLARILDFIPAYDPEIDKPLLNGIFIAGALLLAIHFFPPPSTAALQGDVDNDFPAQVLSYLRAHPPDGHLLNAYEWGGYLGWHDPDLKLFIDSRADIFEYSGVFQDYIDLRTLKDSNKILDKYQIRYVLFPPNEPLIYLLEHDPKWKLTYRDAVSVLFERKAQAAA
jgi:hypothetical protein